MLLDSHIPSSATLELRVYSDGWLFKPRIGSVKLEAIGFQDTDIVGKLAID